MAASEGACGAVQHTPLRRALGGRPTSAANVVWTNGRGAVHGVWTAAWTRDRSIGADVQAGAALRARVQTACVSAAIGRSPAASQPRRTQLADEALVLLVEVRAHRRARLEDRRACATCAAPRRRRARRAVAAVARIAMPNADSVCSGRRAGRPSASARSWHQRRLRVAPPVRLSSPPAGSAQPCELLEAQPLDERQALQEGGGALAVAGGRAERERLGVGRGEREALAARDERIAQHARALVRGGLLAERVQVASRERRRSARRRRCSTRRRAASRRRARGASRSPWARSSMRSRRAALEHERRAEHGVAVAGRRAPAAICAAQPSVMPATIGVPAGQAGLRGGGRADLAEPRAGRDDGGQQVAELACQSRRPGAGGGVIAALEGVAGVRGDGVPGQRAGDDVGLVGEPQLPARGAAAAPRLLLEQPVQLGQRPGRRQVQTAGLLARRGRRRT